MHGISASFTGSVRVASGLYLGADPTDVSTNLVKAVIDVSVSNNTLTLTQANGTVTNFSKATSLSDAWSSGTVTVTASPQGTTLVRTLAAGTLSWSGNVATVPINYTWGSSGQYSGSTGWQVTVDATTKVEASYSAGYGAGVAVGTAAGIASVTVDSITAPSGSSQTATLTATASNTRTKTETVAVTSTGFSDGGTYAQIRIGSTSGTVIAQQWISMPGASSASWSRSQYGTSGQYIYSCTVGGMTYTHVF